MLTHLALVALVLATPWRVGVDRADITPPPRLDTFGHGPNARTSRGHRGRLTCTTIALVREPEPAVVLVACDLHSIGTRLQQQAAAHAGLHPSQLVLSATHTHGGPAHYFTEGAYTGFLSSDRAAASEAYLQHLAALIGSSVRDAVTDARSHPGVAHVAATRESPAVSYAWNRSMEAHCSRDQSESAACAQYNRNPALAVDDAVTLLRFWRGDQALATHVVLPVHPTTIPNTSDVFHPDLHGLVRETLEERLPAVGPFAMANGAEGDVNARILGQTWAEARELAVRLADGIVAIWGSMEPEPIEEVALRYGRMALPRGAYGGASRERDDDGALCPPVLGNAAAAGAESGITWLMVLGDQFREGDTKPQARPTCQNPKRSAQKVLGTGPRAFPTQVPMHRLTIDGWTWVTLPGEATTQAGRDLARAATLPGDTTDRLTLLGLAGGYLQYIATRDEFLLQHYEGASTLYGRNQAERLADRLAELRDGAEVLATCRVEGRLVADVDGRCPKSSWTAATLRERAYPPDASGDDAEFAWLAANDSLEPQADGFPGTARLRRALRLLSDPRPAIRAGLADRGCGDTVVHRIRWRGAPGAAAAGRARVVVREAGSGRVLASDLSTAVEIRLAKAWHFPDVPAFNGSLASDPLWTASWSAPPRLRARAAFELYGEALEPVWRSETFAVGEGDCAESAPRWERLPG